MPPATAPVRKGVTKRHSGSKGKRGIRYMQNNPASYTQFLKDNITDAAVGRVKLLAGGPRIQMSPPAGATGVNNTCAAHELRAFIMAILRTLIMDTLSFTEISRRRLVKVEDFKTALASVRGRRYYK